jgi:hypothetical protein
LLQATDLGEGWKLVTVIEYMDADAMLETRFRPVLAY